jgi:hypothetical protein
MQRTIFLVFTLLSCIVSLSAQSGYGNKWLFGRQYSRGALLDFGAAGLVLDSTFQKDMYLNATGIVMCDSIGDLQFYSNGCYISNASGEKIKNSDGMGLGYFQSYCDGGGVPSPQAMVVLPKPGYVGKYTLFYTDLQPVYDSIYFPIAPTHIYSAEVDMDAEQGKGAVVEKHIEIVNDTLALSSLVAQKHTNGRDWWIVSPEKLSNCYWTILLTHEGIDTVFKQCVGKVWDDDDTIQSCFSPNGKKFARGNDPNGLQLFEFDAYEGIFSNPKIASLVGDTFSSRQSGIAFSPNSRFLYLSSGRKLWQYDLLAPDLEQSRILIGERTALLGVPATAIHSMLLAPDGKIYIGGRTSFNHLHVIHQPNCKGLACNFEQYAVDLTIQSVFTMPNHPNFINWPQDTAVTCLSGLDEPRSFEPYEVQVSPNPVVDVLNVIIPLGLGVQDGLYQIVDMNGRTVQDGQHYTAEFPIFVSELPKGIYWLRIVSDEGVGLEKFVKVDIE